MTIEADLRAFLLADATIAALTGGRVYVSRRPQKAATPAIVVHRIGGMPHTTSDGKTGMREFSAQIDVWAKEQDAARQVAAAIETLAGWYVGAMGASTCHSCTLEAQRDTADEGANEPEYLFGTSLDLLIFYT